MTIESSIDLEAGVGIAVITGEVDLATVEDFVASIETAALDSDGVVIDMQAVTYLDSSGIRALFELTQRRPRIPMVAVVPAESPIRRVMDLVNLAAAVPICESLEEAVTALGQAP